MADAHLRGQTLDDLMRCVIQAIQEDGERITTSRGSCAELTGILLELDNPLARLSRTETRGKPFSSLGELCWYLAKSNELSFIEYYLPKYRDSAEDGKIYGAYGPRLFDWNGINQMANIVNRLTEKPNSRRAAIQLFQASDIELEHEDTPCTCTLQLMLRGGKLNMIAYMRSNDVYWGLPHDIFCFTMLQEILAREISAELGTYKHVVGSLHLYDEKQEAATQFLAEGFQPTDMSMPAMPKGDPWTSIRLLLKSELEIRTGGVFDESELNELDPYWADLVRLLLVFRAVKERDVERIKDLSHKMSSDIFRTFIDMKVDQLS
jgi:thymidylate synthase